jgi:hypothetical protein
MAHVEKDHHAHAPKILRNLHYISYLYGEGQRRSASTACRARRGCLPRPIFPYCDVDCVGWRIENQAIVPLKPQKEASGVTRQLIETLSVEPRGHANHTSTPLAACQISRILQHSKTTRRRNIRYLTRNNFPRPLKRTS